MADTDHVTLKWKQVTNRIETADILAKKKVDIPFPGPEPL